MRYLIITPLLLLSLYIKAINDTCNVSYSFQLNYENRTVNFSKVQAESEVVSFHWDFGDGNEFIGDNPNHTYETDGYYIACVTTRLANGCESTFCDTIRVLPNLANHYNLSGNVYTNQSLLPNGFALLVKSNLETNTIIRITDVTQGYYKFESIPTDVYQIYIIPDFNIDTIYTPIYFPTYLGNSLNWQEGYFVVLNCDLFNADVQLKSNNSIFYGSQEISGQILLDPSANYESSILCVDWESGEMFQEINASNLPIILLNEQYLPVQYTISDENGFFTFKNIPYGKYYVYPEKSGLTTTPFSIDVIYTNSNNFINFSLTRNSITGNSIINNFNVNPLIYPNPTSDYITIALPENVSNVHYQLMNIFSQEIVNNGIINSNNQKVYLTNYSKGNYLLILKKNDEVVGYKIIVKE